MIKKQLNFVQKAKNLPKIFISILDGSEVNLTVKKLQS